MAPRLTQKQQLEKLVEEFEPRLRDAFLKAIADIRDGVVMARLVERIAAGDINGAVAAVGIDADAYQPFAAEITQAFAAGGNAAVETIPRLIGPDGFRAVVRFGMRNPAAETWLRNESSTLITNIAEDQKAAVRETLEVSLTKGDNPTRTATTIVGKINPATGKREGGILGLSKPQAQYVLNARKQLTSGDPDDLAAYLTRIRRDKRFDKTVRKAIKDGTKIPAATVDKMVKAYSNSLLKLRAETIALNETFNSLQAAKHQAYAQQIEAGKLQARHIVKTWKHTPQEDPRRQHILMHGQKVPFDAPFIAPDKTPIMYPHADGVPAYHTIGCKCFVEYKIDFVAQLLATRVAA